MDKINKWGGHTNWGKRTERQKNGNLKEKKDILVNKFGARNNIWEYKNSGGFTTKDDIAYEHPAIFPENLAKDHIKSWSNEGDLVLDPFMGSGTTAKMAEILNRKWIGFELSQKYIDIAYSRVAKVDKEYHKKTPDKYIPQQKKLF